MNRTVKINSCISLMMCTMCNIMRCFMLKTEHDPTLLLHPLQ